MSFGTSFINKSPLSLYVFHNKTGNIILLDDGKIISENTKIAEVFNDYFINIVKDLQIPDIILAEVPVIPQNIYDPIENILYTYHNHPSIIKIRIHGDQAEKFSFSNVTEKQIETEINKLNPKKAPVRLVYPQKF